LKTRCRYIEVGNSIITAILEIVGYCSFTCIQAVCKGNSVCVFFCLHLSEFFVDVQRN
jgi:hypothetical protein